MRFVLFVWPVASFLVLVMICFEAEYGERGPKGEYLIDASNPLWLVLSGFIGLLFAVGLKLLLASLAKSRRVSGSVGKSDGGST